MPVTRSERGNGGRFHLANAEQQVEFRQGKFIQRQAQHSLRILGKRRFRARAQRMDDIDDETVRRSSHA